MKILWSIWDKLQYHKYKHFDAHLISVLRFMSLQWRRVSDSLFVYFIHLLFLAQSFRVFSLAFSSTTSMSFYLDLVTEVLLSISFRLAVSSKKFPYYKGDRVHSDLAQSLVWACQSKFLANNGASLGLFFLFWVRACSSFGFFYVWWLCLHFLAEWNKAKIFKMIVVLGPQWAIKKGYLVIDLKLKILDYG